MRSIALVVPLLAACGPVLLFGDAEPTGRTAPPASQVDASTPDSGGRAGAPALAEPTARDDLPLVRVAVKAIDCGRCFELVASAAGGVPPYRFEWEDGSQSANRRVCANHTTLEVSVVVQDATAARSAAYVARLETETDDAACPPPQLARKLCVTNPSFEGTAAMNSGMPEMFDAAPWSACSNPAGTNTPDIGNESVAQTVPPPKPSHGKTFLGLFEGEQASQKLCEAVPAATERSIQLDLSAIDLTGGVAPGAEGAFLEIWGGVAADCSQHQRLWASDPLGVDWKTYCIKLKPSEFMDLITLRANSSNTSLAPAYLLVDNLVPVDACP